MIIDKPYLETAKADALKQAETFRANLHAAMGYAQAIDAMLARLAEEEPMEPIAPKKVSRAK